MKKSIIHGADPAINMRVAGDNLKIREDGLTINYDDYGPIYAPVVIFIHAFPFNKHMWDMQTEALKSNYRVISYDIRGYGGSIPSDNDYSVPTLAKDLIHLMDLLGIRKAAVCGLSFGGTIALQAVEQYPNRFTALILSDTSCDFSLNEKIPGWQTGFRIIKEQGLLAFAEKSIKSLFAAVSFTKSRDEIKAARKMILNTSVVSICNTLKELGEKSEPCTSLDKIKVPVLILVGRQDEITPPSEAKELQDRIPGSSLKVIECAGHLPNLENTIEFNKLIKAFMDKVCSQRTLSEPLIVHR